MVFIYDSSMKKNDRRNNGIGLLTKIWYYAEAWLELNRLAALCGGRAVLQNRNWEGKQRFK